METYGPGLHSLRFLFFVCFSLFSLAIFEVDIRLHIFFGDWTDFLALILTLKWWRYSFFLGFQVFTVSFLYLKKIIFWDNCRFTCHSEGQYRGIMYILHPVSPKGNIFHNYSAKQYHNQEIDINNLLILFGFHQFSMYSFVCMCIYFMWFHHVSICVFHCYHQN